MLIAESTATTYKIRIINLVSILSKLISKMLNKNNRFVKFFLKIYHITFTALLSSYGDYNY